MEHPFLRARPSSEVVFKGGLLGSAAAEPTAGGICIAARWLEERLVSEIIRARRERELELRVRAAGVHQEPRPALHHGYNGVLGQRHPAVLCDLRRIPEKRRSER